jgi:hypothetical protein
MAITQQTSSRHTLTDARVDFFWEHGYLHIPEVFTAEETGCLVG